MEEEGDKGETKAGCEEKRKKKNTDQIGKIQTDLKKNRSLTSNKKGLQRERKEVQHKKMRGGASVTKTGSLRWDFWTNTRICKFQAGVGWWGQKILKRAEADRKEKKKERVSTKVQAEESSGEL